MLLDVDIAPGVDEDVLEDFSNRSAQLREKKTELFGKQIGHTAEF